MSSEIYRQICSLLDQNCIAYRAVEHEPTMTSEQSAAARGEPLEVGGKALLIKLDDQFKLFVLSAARKIDSKNICDVLGAKKCRFATKEELLKLTGLVPGSVPPFGAPILPFPLYVDSSIVSNSKIAFNAGSLTNSLILATSDYLAVAKPEIFTFSAVAV